MDNSDSKGKKRHGQLRLSEKIIGIVALVVLAGWVVGLAADGEKPSDGFPWFGSFSIAGCVLVLTLIILKLNCLEFFPAKIQERLLPIVSLLPVLGFLINELRGLEALMTVGGSMVLAYISATSYWRNYIPDFVTNPLGVDEEGAATPPTESESEPESKEAAAETAATENAPASESAAAEATSESDESKNTETS